MQTRLNQVVVFGGAGFIGQKLVYRLLSSGSQVLVIDARATGGRSIHPRLTACTPGTEALRDAVAAADACFNLSIDDAGMDLIASATLESGRRIPVVYASSAAVYGPQPAGSLIDETAKLRATTSYGKAKIAVEEKARMLGWDAGIATVGLRLFNVYAETQDARTRFASVITRYMDALRSGRPITLTGSGTQMRDFIHVDDVVEAMLASVPLASAAGPVFNCCTEVGTTICGLVARLEQLLGQEARIEHAPSPEDDVPFSVGDAGRLHRMTGFAAGISLSEGLLRYVEPGIWKPGKAVAQVA